MTKLLLFALLLVAPFGSKAQDQWMLCESKGSRCINLYRTAWASSRGGEKIYFGDATDGHFQSGMRFNYLGGFYFREGQMVKESRTEGCNLLRIRSATPFNVLRLSFVNNRPVLTDKKGIAYANVRYGRQP